MFQLWTIQTHEAMNESNPLFCLHTSFVSYGWGEYGIYVDKAMSWIENSEFKIRIQCFGRQTDDLYLAC